MIPIDGPRIRNAYFKGFAPANAPDAVVFPKASAGQISGFSQLLEFLAADPHLSDPRHAAYTLATARHECAGEWQPIPEYRMGYGREYARVQMVVDADGQVHQNSYFGRGYVQLTWKENYQTMGEALGMGQELYIHPDLALQPSIAYQIMSLGMRLGKFTGKKLSDYINESRCDYVEARRIINGIDCAEKIAAYANEFESLLIGAATTSEVKS